MASPQILLGTSSFTAPGWRGTFYPAGMSQRGYLPFYAEHFDTVEIDSTFYRAPTAQTVQGWDSKTPKGFVFSLKVPQTITHERVLLNCQPEFESFVDTASLLKDKLGPMVFQFPFFNSTEFRGRSDFVARLKPFLASLPKHDGHKFAVEIRNKAWLDADFADLLREHGVALVLQDQSWMPHPNELAKLFDTVTADFIYIRWLGDRKGIERITKTFDRIVDDKTNQLSGWVDVCETNFKRGIKAYVYANNHYEGYAPATIEKFRNLWHAKGLPELERPRRVRQESSLFED